MQDSIDRPSWSNLALAGVLVAMSEIARKRRERLTAFDPTEDAQTGSLLQALGDAAGRARTHYHRWKMVRWVASTDGDVDRSHVDAVAGLLAASRLEGSIRTIHQLLMGLYPDVDAHVVEKARVSAEDLATWISEPVYAAEIEADIGELLRIVETIRAE